MKTYSITTYLLLVAVCLAFSIGAAELTPCDVPSEVSHCMNLMRTGEDLDEATERNFMHLEERMTSLRMESCDWKGADLKMTAGDCVTTLSRFVEEKGNDAGMTLNSSVRISGRQCRRRCRSKCPRSPPRVRRYCFRLCNGIVLRPRVNVSVRQCRAGCRRRCFSVPRRYQAICLTGCGTI